MSVLIGHAKANRALAWGFRLEANRADADGHSRTAYQLRRMAAAYDAAASALEEQMRAEASRPPVPEGDHDATKAHCPICDGPCLRKPEHPEARAHWQGWADHERRSFLVNPPGDPLPLDGQ